MPRPYFTLVTYDTVQKKYFPQFGDYDRSVVKQEQEDSYAGELFKIVRSRSSRKKDVGEAIKKLNDGPHFVTVREIAKARKQGLLPRTINAIGSGFTPNQEGHNV